MLLYDYMKLNVSLLMAVYITNDNYDSYSQNLSHIILILILLYNITYKYQLNANGAACYAKGIVKYRIIFFKWNTNIIAFHTLFVIILCLFSLRF